MGVVGRPGWFWLLQVVKVTDVQFGFLKLDFDQVEVALIAFQPQQQGNCLVKTLCEIGL